MKHTKYIKIYEFIIIAPTHACTQKLKQTKNPEKPSPTRNVIYNMMTVVTPLMLYLQVKSRP